MNDLMSASELIKALSEAIKAIESENNAKKRALSFIPMDDYAEIIVAERKRQNMTQQDLADIAGVSNSTIRKIESGKANPSLSAVLMITNALGMKMGFVK